MTNPGQPPDEQLPRDFGPYRLERFIAAGGMARVYQATRTDGEEPLVQVVKLMRPELSSDEQGPAMFRDEARLAHQLVHPNIVRVYDFGAVGGDLFMAMELIDGPNIAQLVRAINRAIPARVAIQITMKLCEALQHAHTMKDPAGRPLHLVHRDVSPQNVLLTRQGGVKLADFGVAKVAFGREAETRTNYVKGKIGYMSPEQLLGRALDARSDIFAAGIVLWEMLVGRRLFKEKTDALAIQKVVYGQAEKPSLVNRNLPGSLDAVILQALAKEPDQRFPDAHAFHRALAAILPRFPAQPGEELADLVAIATGLPALPPAVDNDSGSQRTEDEVRQPSVRMAKPYTRSEPASASGPTRIAPGNDAAATRGRTAMSAQGGAMAISGGTQSRTQMLSDEDNVPRSIVPGKTSGLPVAFIAVAAVLVALAFAGGRFTAPKGEGADCGHIATDPKKIDAAYDLAVEAQRNVESGNMVTAVDRAQVSIDMSATARAHFVLFRAALFEHRTKESFFHLMCASRLDADGEEVRWVLDRLRRRD